MHNLAVCTQQVPWQTLRRLWLRSKAAAWTRGPSGRLLCPDGKACHRSVDIPAACIFRVSPSWAVAGHKALLAIDLSAWQGAA